MFGKPRVRARTLFRCLSWFPKAVVNVPELLYDIKGKEFFGVPIPDVFTIVYTPPLNLINSKNSNSLVYYTNLSSINPQLCNSLHQQHVSFEALETTT